MSNPRATSTSSSEPSPKVGVGARLFALLAAFLLSTGAAPPEVVRVHIPAGQVTTWFPAGTELRMLSAGQFDSLLERARRGAKGTALAPPRLIRAHHHARWGEGMLTGSSELIVEVQPAGSTTLELDPWTPMVVSRGGKGYTAAGFGSGKTGIALEPSSTGGSVGVTLEWVQRAHQVSEGRTFTLGLPGDATSVLSLEVPTGMVPVGPLGFRQGPLPSSRPGLQTWRFHGPIGQVNLQLLESPARQDPGYRPRTWVGGPTVIRLGSTSGRGSDDSEPLANWTTDWTVQPDPLGAMEFTALLDPGLELIKVKGDEVREFRAEPEGQATRVKVLLSSTANRPILVQFEAHARVPVEGAWRVPAVRPLDAIWTGGTTTIVLDPLHLVQDLTERSGRRLPGRETVSPDNMMVFEARSPDSVADFVFQQPRARATVAIQGQVVVRQDATELECRINGAGGRGPESELEIQLSPTWLPVRVRRAGVEESLSWQVTVQPDGGTRLRVLIPSNDGEPVARQLLIEARSSVAGGRGPILLPRIRPLGMPVSDETWVALVGDAVALNPTSARGLVWIEPSQVLGLLSDWTARASDLRPALAWRWNEEKAEAQVDREQVQRQPRGQIECRVQIDPDGRHLALEGHVLVLPGSQPQTTVPIWIGQPGGDLRPWSFRLDADNTELMTRPLDGPARTRFEFPETGLASELLLASPHREPLLIRFKARFPWDKHGSIPVLCLPQSFLPRGTVLVEVPRNIRSRAQASGLRRIDSALSRAILDCRNQDRDCRPGRRPDQRPRRFTAGPRIHLHRARRFARPEQRRTDPQPRRRRFQGCDAEHAVLSSRGLVESAPSAGSFRASP